MPRGSQACGALPRSRSTVRAIDTRKGVSAIDDYDGGYEAEDWDYEPDLDFQFELESQFESIGWGDDDHWPASEML